MIESIIGVVIALAVIGIIYVVLKWILGLTGLSVPPQVLNIVFGVVALIMVLRYLATII